jgi:hypothetical protein
MTQELIANDIAVALHATLVDARLEIAVEGHEAAIGLTACRARMRVDRYAIVRQPGRTLRVNSSHLATLKRTDPLAKLLGKYQTALTSQIAQNTLCNRLHALDERLARKLLMASESCDSDALYATHQAIGERLHIRRSSVTVVAAQLQDLKIITYSRGLIRILDPTALAARSCSCHGVIHARCDHVFSRPH